MSSAYDRVKEAHTDRHKSVQDIETATEAGTIKAVQQDEEARARIRSAAQPSSLIASVTSSIIRTKLTAWAAKALLPSKTSTGQNGEPINC